jgi:hypothetical protein
VLRARASLRRARRPSAQRRAARCLSSLLTRLRLPFVSPSLAQLCVPPAAPLRLAALPGRLLLIGFGSIGAGVLPLLLRHVCVPAARVTLLTAPDRGPEATHAAATHGLACVIATLTPDNYRQVRTHAQRAAPTPWRAFLRALCARATPRNSNSRLAACLAPLLPGAFGLQNTRVDPARARPGAARFSRRWWAPPTWC